MYHTIHQACKDIKEIIYNNLETRYFFRDLIYQHADLVGYIYARANRLQYALTDAVQTPCLSH